MEKPVHVKCYRCGSAAAHRFAYALFSEREAFLGVVYRGVCRQCLNDYIDRVKTAKRGRAEGLLWIAIFLPTGLLFAGLAAEPVFRAVGFGFIALALLLPVAARILQWREAAQAKRADDAENEAKYSELICREDAHRTNRHTKLVQLRPEYAQDSVCAERIGEENGVSAAIGETIRQIAGKAFAAMQSEPLPDA